MGGSFGASIVWRVMELARELQGRPFTKASADKAGFLQEVS